MNKILSLLFGVMLAVSAQAQFAPGQGNAKGLVINITTNFYLPGITTTNIPAALALPCPIGRNGIGFGLRVGATNAASTTNMTIVLEQTYNGTDYADDHTFTLSIPFNGTTGHDVYTNLLPTTVNLGNAASLRVKSIQNTNVLGCFITNFYWTVSQ